MNKKDINKAMKIKESLYNLKDSLSVASKEYLLLEDFFDEIEKEYSTNKLIEELSFLNRKGTKNLEMLLLKLPKTYRENQYFKLGNDSCKFIFAIDEQKQKVYIANEFEETKGQKEKIVTEREYSELARVLGNIEKRSKRDQVKVVYEFRRVNNIDSIA